MNFDDSPRSNTPEFSVSELALSLKRTLEDTYAHVRLRGEISGYRGPHSSGHVYFALKDQNAKIDAIIWKGQFSKLKFKPQEGLEVVAVGKISTFPGKSNYQIIIEQMEPAGVGALMALLEERKARLLAEGLFDAARKKPLPYLPRVIGVITSPTGAVIHDMLHRLAERFPRHILLWPVKVQGEGSAEEVVAAIHGFNTLLEGGAIPRPDLLIVARGGGSLEDLWSFNEESVARAVAASRIPIISAIGHETDTTLIDFVSDRRAPTPTAAAEMAVPVRSELLNELGSLGLRLHSVTARNAERRRSDFRALTRLLPKAEQLLAQPWQRLDLLARALPQALLRVSEEKRGRLILLIHRLQLQSPQSRLARMRDRLRDYEARLNRFAREPVAWRRIDVAALSQRLVQGFKASLFIERQKQSAARIQLTGFAGRLRQAEQYRLQKLTERLNRSAALLGALGYRNVLQRGYVLVRDENGLPIRRAGQAAQERHMLLEFIDGRVDVQPIHDAEISNTQQIFAANAPQELMREKAEKPAKKPIPPKEPKLKKDDGQTSLF